MKPKPTDTAWVTSRTKRARNIMIGVFLFIFIFPVIMRLLLGVLNMKHGAAGLGATEFKDLVFSALFYIGIFFFARKKIK